MMADPAKRVDCGDLPFIIKRDGSWLYRGSPIARKPMVCLFSTVLQRIEDGTYLLETPTERGRIEVEDVPFVAVELDSSPGNPHGHKKMAHSVLTDDLDQRVLSFDAAAADAAGVVVARRQRAGIRQGRNT